MRWDIGRHGKLLDVERFSMAPEKIELVDGKLFWSEEERMTMLALLLENIGVDRAVRVGKSEVWREAVAQLSK